MKHDASMPLMINAFSWNQFLSDHVERCIKQKPTNNGFGWQDKIVFEDHNIKVPFTYRVYTDFECNNHPTGSDKEVIKQIPIAVG